MVDCSRVVYDSSNSSIITTSHTNSQKSVVLTFDDGPSRLLPSILDVLKKEEIQAVFFWQSKLIYPARPWKRLLDEGHQIGTHSTKHRNLAALTYEKQYQDIRNSIRKIEEITGTKLEYFRPPYGQYNKDTIKAAEALNVTPVLWRLASMDWELKDDPNQIVTYVTDNLEDGAIILLHELTQTLEVLPALIQAIRDKGYGFSKLKIKGRNV
ncbi:polysaccharide deacetylase family protein [Virgibacillus flavescens]|uniref:polysaccharide deacetylase family protein n=1 Tax=Virgibacillus flavescens TaxID=1611422 RepID=UPI003D332314